MYYVFNKSSIGYSHIKNKKPCQDYSASYQDNERMIVTCCDGHGGPQYVRSQVGSKLASEAVINVFKAINKKNFRGNDNELLKEKIKLLILCEYNKYIERELAAHPIRKSEVEGLDEDIVDTLRFNPSKAYGTTLSGAMVFANKIIVVSIGDTETLGISKGNLIKIFDNSNDPAGNVTYSMCQEDAFKYLRVAILEEGDLDGVILCTDGMSSPYQNYTNLHESLIKPMVRTLAKTQSLAGIDSHVEKVAKELGVGDDVSLAFIIKSNVKSKLYK